MKSLENADWIFLNSMILKIHSIEDSMQMRETLIQQLRLIMDFDCATFYVASHKDGLTLENPVVYNVPPEFAQRYINDFFALDYSKSFFFGGKSIIYRETDIMSDEKRVGTDYYKTFYEPFGWHYSISMVIAYNAKFLGVLTLFRNQGKPNFKYDDVFILEILKDHLEFRLYGDRAAPPSANTPAAGAAFQKYGLTRREEMVLGDLAAGKDNRAICDELYITNNTLKKHILNIYRKLGVKNRVGLLQMVRDLNADHGISG
jgi:Response regulator containing a CheY-like receiver domain and an HTH DNA-binding domain